MTQHRAKLTIGLTGGIGCGKSTVAALFAKSGAQVIDSDAISHQLTGPDGAAITAIRSAFGDDYIDPEGGLDRARMRQLAFSDAASKQLLESILHPLIRTRMLAQSQMTPDAAPYVLLVVPLLFEAAGYRELVQRTLAVDCTERTQIARAMQRSGLNEQDVRAIMAQQISRTERLQLADDIIENDADLNALQPRVQQLHQHYLSLCAGRD
jgi:dephospho-CoA kinase